MAGRGESQRVPVSALRTELLHESDRTRVTRSVFPDGTLIRKELLGPDGEKRRRRELSVLDRLSGVDGVVQLAGDQPSSGSILLEDVHGEPLSDVDKPLEVASLTALAVELARVVAAIHERGVIHRDLNPSNVVLAEGHPVIIDFTLATTAVESRPAFTHHTEIVGTLPYLAPEQTSRMGRPVDQRSDLYELGATLYELATGEPPFRTGLLTISMPGLPS